MISTQFSLLNSCLSRNINFRQFSVKTSKHVLMGINLADQKLQSLSKDTIYSPLTFQRQWEKPTPIRIHCDNSFQRRSQPKNFYYIGGLPALMQAAQKLERGEPDINVFYVRDQETPKTLLSGHQGHVHPTEWPTTECGYQNLIKVMLQGMHLIKHDDPAALSTYSYLHFSLNLSEILAHPLNHLNMFGCCFIQRIKQTMSSDQLGLSKNDQWLCDTVAKSLQFHNRLSADIERTIGKPTFSQNFRIYWSPDQEKMQKKEDIWKKLAIPVSRMEENEKIRYTLLNDTPLHILKINSDGKFYPETPVRIAQYLTQKYHNFSLIDASVTDVYTNAWNVQGIAMKMICSQELSLRPADYVFASPGHNQVMTEHTLTQNWKPLWSEIPVSGITSTWKCTLKRQELQKRLGSIELTDEQLKSYINGIVPAANLSNLHVTSWDCNIEHDDIILMVRVSEGANFNSHVAFKNDLFNMSHNLDQYFIGDWELMTVGSCTRKTWATNTPEFVELSDNLKFIHGLSGIGYSFSGAPIESLKHP